MAATEICLFHYEICSDIHLLLLNAQAVKYILCAKRISVLAALCYFNEQNEEK